MKYILKNKDIDILSFEVNQYDTLFNGVADIEEKIENIIIKNKDLIPKNICGEINNEALEKFIKQRKAPSHRQFIKNIIASYSDGNETLMDYVNVSLALSLNDTYWIVKQDSNVKWIDYSLYTNNFDERLEKAAFGITDSKIKEITSSPEFTTNGMLKKCWHRDNGVINLYKGQIGKEAFSEYYMAQIGRTMGFNCIDYDLKEFHNEIVSACEIFTSEKVGFLPMAFCLNEKERKLKSKNLIKAIQNNFGSNELEDIFLFDSIIYNIDRHLGNFGMLIDNDDNKLIKLAPIFDNGYSLVSNLNEQDLKDINKSQQTQTSFFELNFDEQLKFFAKPRHKQALEALEQFKFKKHKRFNLNDEWLDSLQKHFNKRAIKALEIIKNRQISLQDIEKPKSQTQQKLSKLIINKKSKDITRGGR